MKTFAIIAAALALASCQKSADQQFEEMYVYQLKHDPEFASSTRGSYENRAYLSDQQKMQLVRAYESVKAARAAVENAR